MYHFNFLIIKYLRFTESPIISCFHSVEIDTTETQDCKKAEQNSSTRHFVSIALDFFNRLYGTDPEKIFLNRFITYLCVQDANSNRKSYFHKPEILSYLFKTFCSEIHCLPTHYLIASYARVATYSKFIIYPTTFNQRVLDLKAAKSQEVFSFLSHLQKNERNLYPSTFQSNGKI